MSFPKLTPVSLTLALAPSITILAPMIPAIHHQMMIVIMLLALIVHVAAHVHKNRLDAGLSSFVFLSFLISYLVFPHQDQRLLALRTAAVLAMVLLNAVLLIGPWSRFSSRLLPIYACRRHLGVLTFLLAQLHFALIFSSYFDYSFANAFMALFTFFGFTAYFIMLFLALTSWDWLQKHVGNRRWQWLHAVIFVAYVAIAGYAFWDSLSNQIPIETWQWVALATFLISWIVMAPWGLAPKIINYLQGWKQLHVLVHIAYAAVVLHAWFGTVLIQPTAIKIIFWSLVMFTWGSHLIGWYFKWREDQRLERQARQATEVMIDGKKYWSTKPVSDFVEGKGQRFLIQGRPIAIFRHHERFFGLFAICAHQKGPIDKGTIVNGYVECPWHHWQYSCDAGTAPPPFKDRLAFYPCVVQNDFVYVSVSPLLPNAH